MNSIHSPPFTKTTLSFPPAIRIFGLYKCLLDVIVFRTNLFIRDKEIISKVLINVCVRMFIESHEKQVIHFISRFQSLATSDEKVCSIVDYGINFEKALPRFIDDLGLAALMIIIC